MLIGLVQFGCGAGVGVQSSADERTPAQPAQREDVSVRIAEIVARQAKLEAKEIDVDAPFAKQNLKLDELDIVEIVLAVEESFNVQIRDEEVDQGGNILETLSVRKLADIVLSKRKP